MQKQMNDQQFAQALKNYPCPECGTVGMLEPHKMLVKALHKGKTVEASGEGSICRACNSKFMSDEMTESIANQVQRIEGGAMKYIEVNRETGELKGHPIQ